MNKQHLACGLILFAGFCVRLYKIDNPIADWHSWRQADTSAVTRNYVKHGIDLFHPRYDDFTDVSGKGLFNPQGYRFVEFPIFNLVHYSIYKLDQVLPNINYPVINQLDSHPITKLEQKLNKLVTLTNTIFSLLFAPKSIEFTGRLTSALAAVTSALILFAIVKRKSNFSVAFLACGFYLFLPYNIYFTRVVLPDPLMVTLFLACLNFYDLKKPIPTLIFGSLAILVKPVAVFFLIPIFLQNLWLGLMMLAPFGLWRYWSYQFPQGVPASGWLLNGNGIRFKPSFFQWLFGVRIGTLILGKWGIWPLISGITNLVKPFGIWIFGALLYLVVFATGNIQHDYYQIPIIPIISILLALGSYHLWTTTTKPFLNKLLLVTTLVFMFGFSWYDIRGLYQINNYPIVLAGLAVDKLTPKESVVVAPYEGDTAFLYQTNRPGFPYMYMPIKDMIDRYSADYYVSVNYDAQTKDIMNKYIVVEQKPEYVIVKLEEPRRP